MPASTHDTCPLPVEVSLQQLARRASRAHETFKFEPRADYPDMHDNCPSVAAWLRGDREASRALMERERDLHVHPWGNRHSVRVRVIDETPTPFVAWELEVFARIHIPTLGETVHLLPRAALRDTDVPSGDVILLDRRCAYINGYDDDHDGLLQYQTVLDADEGDNIRGMIQLEDRLMHLATTYGRRLEPAV